MKLNGITGKGSGKLGSSVFAISGGEQIVREYQPTVTNPSTEGQVSQRSKFKLMSQLSAAMAPAIAIRKEGMKSPRNIFSSINMQFTNESEGVAQVNLNKIQLTKSNQGIAEFAADRTVGTNIAVNLTDSMANALDRVVYVAFKKQADGSLMQYASTVVSEAGANGQFAGTLPYTADSVVIYAYGMRANSDKAKAAYANMLVPTAEQVAKLIASSSEIAGDTTLTRTKALTMNLGETDGSSDSEEHFLVSVSASGNGSVTGGGSFTAGQTCTLRATPDAEASFVAWKRGSASGATLSTNATYSFEVTEAIAIVGVFQGGPTPKYQINASVDPANAGTVSGTGLKEEGSTATLQFTLAQGSELVFGGWYENNVLVSSANPYNFTVDHARTLVAKAVEPSQSHFSNVKMNNSEIVRNDFVSSDTPTTYSGNVSDVPSGGKVVFVASNTKPSVDADVEYAIDMELSGNAFSKQLTLSGFDTYWFVLGTPSTSGHVTVVDVFEYSVTVQGF